MTFSLNAVLRKEKGEKVRWSGQLPAVVYGAGNTTESLSLNPQEFLKLYKQAGDSSLIDLVVDGKDVGKVLVQEVQADPVSNKVMHVDFRRIDMKKEMTAPVVLRFVGEAPIVKSSGGTLVTTVSTVEVKCLPKDLVSHLDVDISGFISYDQVIKIKDIKLPAGITIVSPHAEDLVMKAARALTEDEIKAMEEASKAPVDLSKIESAGKKKEEEEGAEGEAKAEGAAPKAEEKKEEKKK
ncbi:MAG: 50S ribosomal protein L25 [Patescibacteria group bacterium]|jgi:large subunit ribosomal protein L25